MLSNWQTLSLIPTCTNTDSSCSVLCRASTSRNVSQIKEVHGRDNLGHAAAGRSRMTLFGIMACKIQSRLWVIRDVFAMSALLPLYPLKPTFIARGGMSVWCQNETCRIKPNPCRPRRKFAAQYPRLFRQPRSSQALFVSRDVFRPPVRSHCIPQIGNAPRGVELPQSCQRFLCLLQPPGESVACGSDAQCIEVIGPLP